MRAAGALASRVLAEAGRAIQPGITTDAIDVLVHRLVVEAGAYPSPLNYGEFPKSVCTSLNEVICHGIPDSTVLEASEREGPGACRAWVFSSALIDLGDASL